MENLEYSEEILSNKILTESWILNLYSMYKTMLFRIAFSYLGNKQDCEDVIQEAFIKRCYNAPDFESEEDEKRWMIRITINLCKNHLKSFWNRKRITSEDLESYAYEPEEKEILISILHLSGKYKNVLYLYYFEGYKITEITQILSLSESAVKMRLKRGRELLKMELEDVR